MDLVNDSPFEVGWLVSQIEPPRFSLTAVVKGTFRLQPDGVAVPADEQRVPTGDELVQGENKVPVLHYPMDFAPFKPVADLLLVGRAHGPDGKPAGGFQVSFRVGSFTKALAVIGDRFWLESNQSTEPAPFVSMPLGWDRSYGGPEFELNPIGKGHRAFVRSDGSITQPLPNIESLSELINERGQRVMPAGFGPIPDGWPQRARKFGKISGRYLKERWPFYPATMDWGFFNAAPEDQQWPGYLRGDEDVMFENLHPTISQFRSRLPGLRVRCFLNELVRAHEELREIPMKLDTLWVQPESEALVLVWRGHLNVRTEKLLEVYHLLTTTEPLATEPAPLGRFNEVLRTALARRDAEDEELEPEDEPEDEEAEEIELESPGDAEPVETEETVTFEPGLDQPAPAALEFDADTEGQNEEELAIEPAEEIEQEIEEAPELDDLLTVEQVRQKLRDGESFAGCDLSGLVLTGFDFSGRDFQEAILEGAVLVRARLVGANFSGTVLAGANLREADCSGAHFAGADLTEAWISNAVFTAADLRGADFTKARARQVNLVNAHAADSVWVEADLSEADLSGADFTAADLCKCRLHRTNLSQANLTDAAIEEAWGRGVNARGAILRKLRGANSLLCEGDFRDVQAEDSVWQFAQLYVVNFTGAKLDRAEFSTAYLGESVFNAAEMKGACLDESNLRSARLIRSNLLQASLDKADLTGANFTESNLYGASLMNTVVELTQWSGANLRRIKSKEEVT